jgi:hypothetical protein
MVPQLVVVKRFLLLKARISMPAVTGLLARSLILVKEVYLGSIGWRFRRRLAASYIVTLGSNWNTVHIYFPFFDDKLKT